MSTSSTTITLPHWAFVAIGKSDINTLIDRCEYETIIVTRHARTDLVMMGHAEWVRLTAQCDKADRTWEAKATQSDGVIDTSET